MKQIVINGEKLGPFVSVETLDDGYRVESPADAFTTLPFSVVGEGVVGKWVGDVPEPEPTRATVEECKAWMYEHFNDTAKADDWDNRSTLYERLANPDGFWYPVAKSFADWMDLCERAALQHLGSGEPLPVNRAAFLAMLPTWEKPQ